SYELSLVFTAYYFILYYGYIYYSFFFFFSSRRRHTRWPRDWSSDVCSSDLAGQRNVAQDIRRGCWPDWFAAARRPHGFRVTCRAAARLAHQLVISLETRRVSQDAVGLLELEAGLAVGSVMVRVKFQGALMVGR